MGLELEHVPVHTDTVTFAEPHSKLVQFCGVEHLEAGVCSIQVVEQHPNLFVMKF